MGKQVDEITRAVMRLYDDVTHTDARGQIDLDRVREHFAELHDALYARQDPPTLSLGAKKSSKAQSAFDRAVEFQVEYFDL